MVEAASSALSAQLQQFLSRPENQCCADCSIVLFGVIEQYVGVFADVTHGTFICEACNAAHRSVGSHVSRTKQVSGETHTPTVDYSSQSFTLCLRHYCFASGSKWWVLLLEFRRSRFHGGKGEQKNQPRVPGTHLLLTHLTLNPTSDSPILNHSIWIEMSHSKGFGSISSPQG